MITLNTTDITLAFNSIRKLAKKDALAAIAAAFPAYEVTDVYTVRDNLTAAFEQAAQLAAEAQPKNEAMLTAESQETIDSLLVALNSATTKNEKKNIRAKLRRRGYRVSDHRGEE